MPLRSSAHHDRGGEAEAEQDACADSAVIKVELQEGGHGKAGHQRRQVCHVFELLTALILCHAQNIRDFPML